MRVKELQDIFGVKEIALAAQVALRLDGLTPESQCPAWMEAAGKTCDRDTLDGSLLCKRHNTVANKRFAKRVEAEEQRRLAK